MYESFHHVKSGQAGWEKRRVAHSAASRCLAFICFLALVLHLSQEDVISQSICSSILLPFILPSLFFFRSCFPSLILSFRIFILKENYNLILIKRAEVDSWKGPQGTFNRKIVFASLQSPTCHDKILLFSSKMIFMFNDYISMD